MGEKNKKQNGFSPSPKIDTRTEVSFGTHKENLYSFAQEYEDIILYHMLKNVTEPIYYIDVGANDPIALSVTKFFYLRGGHGINIEPQHELIEKLNADRPNDVNLEVGVGNQLGSLKLYGTGTTASFDSNINRENSVKEVPILTLKDICNRYLSENDSIHFLKIDVEGFEKQCLEGMDFQTFRPWIVCMESTEPGTDIPSWATWENLLLSQGYDFVGMNGINRYYVSEESQEKLNEFCNEVQLQSLYEIFLALKPSTNNMDEHRRMRKKLRHSKNIIIVLSIMLVLALSYIFLVM